MSRGSSKEPLDNLKSTDEQVNFSEAVGPDAGGGTWHIEDRDSWFYVYRERTYRTHYVWTGGGTPTAINRVSVSWTAMSQMIQDAGGDVANYAYLKVGTCEYQATGGGGSFLDAGTYTTGVVRNGNTAYVDLSYKYIGSTFPWDGPGTGGGMIGVTIAAGTPYWAP